MVPIFGTIFGSNFGNQVLNQRFQFSQILDSILPNFWFHVFPHFGSIFGDVLGTIFCIFLCRLGFKCVANAQASKLSNKLTIKSLVYPNQTGAIAQAHKQICDGAVFKTYHQDHVIKEQTFPNLLYDASQIQVGFLSHRKLLVAPSLICQNR